MEVETLLLLAVALPWLATLLVLVLRNTLAVAVASSVAIGAALLAVVYALIPAGMNAGVAEASPVAVTLAEVVSGVGITFHVDAAGVFFALVVGALWPAATVYSAGYLDATDADSQVRFFACFSASIGAVVGIAFAANLLTLFVCYELLTVATYPLVVHSESESARVAGRKYALYAMTGGVAVLAGTVLVYAAVGSVSFTPGGIAGIATTDPMLAQAAFALLVAGFGVKAALVPLHGWLPDAMVAPTPVSALLHAVAVVKSGVFGIARLVLYVYGPDGIEALGVGLPLALVATFTMLLAGLLALRQDRLKRGLAYSTVSHLSYIVLGLAVLTPTAVHGALLHLSAHAFMKIVLFFCAGIVYVETHVEHVADLRGIGRRLPATMVLFGVASAGLVGLPLVAGFVSKFYLLTGLVQGEHLGFAVALLAGGLLKLLFFWPIVAGAFAPTRESPASGAATGVVHADGGNPTEPATGSALYDHAHTTEWESRTWRSETDWRLLAPVAIALAVAVVFGVVPTELPFFDLAARIVEVVG